MLLADDHALMRRSLRLLLEDEEVIDVSPRQANWQLSLARSRADEPHVLVLDLSMPGGSSIEAIRRLREQRPTPRS